MPQVQKFVPFSMDSLSLASFVLSAPPMYKFRPRLRMRLKHRHHLCSGSAVTLSSLSLTASSTIPTLLRATDSNIDAPVSFPEGDKSVIHFEEVIEKDWSVLDSDETNEFKRSIDRIVSAGKIEENSRVLVSTGSEELVDCLVNSYPSNFLLVVHDSLLILAGIKEKYDKVKCWQGEIIYVPEKWVPFDVMFLYFLPALPFKLEDILGSLSKKCSPGGRVVISHPQGRELLEQQREQHPLVVISDLPDKTTLQSVAAAHSFDVAEFVDEPGLYLAVLICSGLKN